MNFQKVQKKNRKAISPVLATVILIAITLIAAIAIAGFVFGLFGQFTTSFTPSVSVSQLSHTPGTVGTLLAACGAVSGANLVVSNTGTAAGSVSVLTLTYSGHTETVALTGTCTIGASGSGTSQIGISVTAFDYTASAGEAFTGQVSGSSGGQAAFAGTFS